MVRNTILAKFAITSTLVLLLVYLIFTSFSIKPGFIASFIWFDTVVTASCLLLMFKFTDNIYFCFCSKCHERGMKRRVAKARINNNNNNNKREKNKSASLLSPPLPPTTTTTETAATPETPTNASNESGTSEMNKNSNIHHTSLEFGLSGGLAPLPSTDKGSKELELE